MRPPIENLFKMPAAIFPHLLIATAFTGILLNFYACDPFYSEPEDFVEKDVTRKTDLNRLGVSHVMVNDRMVVIITNIMPRRYTLRDDPAPVLGVIFETSGVNLVMTSAQMRRQVPLVSSGDLEIERMTVEHFHESIRVVLEITHLPENAAR